MKMRLANYTGRDLKNLCVLKKQTVRDAMQIMSDAGLRLIPVISSDGFVGIAADGDLRRFISRGGTLEDEVGKAANLSPKIIEHDMPASEVRTYMLSQGVEYLPLVSQGRLVSLYVLWATSTPQTLTAVIMAGGLGSRLAPLTDDCPKPLIPIGGKPILTHIIQNLQSQGVTNFVISVNYLSEMIIDHYGDGTDLGVEISYVHEKERMGTGGSLSLLDAAKVSEPFLCLNGDILNDIDIASLQELHQTKQWNATMVVRDFQYTVPYGVVNVSEGGTFLGAEEKPTSHYMINAGFYLLSKSILNVIPRGEFYDLPTLFSDLLERGMNGGTFLHSGRWIDVGNIAELERARSIFEGPHQ